MQIDINVPLTLVIAILVLIIGRVIIANVAFLRTYSIPEPVVGGIVAALAITLARAAMDANISRRRCCSPSSPPSG